MTKKNFTRAPWRPGWKARDDADVMAAAALLHGHGTAAPSSPSSEPPLAPPHPLAGHPGVMVLLREVWPFDWRDGNKDPRIRFEQVVVEDGHDDAVRKSLQALRRRGIEVGLLKDDVLPVEAGATKRGVPADYAGDDPHLCNACRRRDGKPCRALKVPGRKRCRWHGGLSTGPRTAEGKAKVTRNLPRCRNWKP